MAGPASLRSGAGTTALSTSRTRQGQASCSITITEYGAVDEPVRGTFSGVVAGSGESKTITNGSFDVIRGTDF